MLLKLNLYYYIVAGLILLSSSLFIVALPILQFIIGTLFLLLLAAAYGEVIAEHVQTIYKLLLGFVATLCIVIIGGAILIYTLTINSLSISALWLLIFLVPVFFLRKNKTELTINFHKPQIQLLNSAIGIVLIGLIASLVYIYFRSATTEVIASVWNILPINWFYLYITTSVLLVLFILKAKSNSWLIYTSLYFLISVSIGAILFKLGYGFDFHIHSATTSHIWETGTIQPKPLYYIGYYSLILNLKWLLGLSLTFLNQWLLPILLSILTPGFIYFSLANSFDFNKIIIRFLPLTFLLVPYSIYTYSTPQSLANMFFLILALSGIPLLFKSEMSKNYLWLIAVAICFIHPITGVPSFLLIFFLSLKQWRVSNYTIGKERQILFGILAILAALALPLLFFINSYINGNTINWVLPKITASLPIWHNFISFFDFIYNIAWLLALLAVALSVGGIIYALRMKRFKQFFEYLLVISIIVVDYVWLRYFINFNWLIDGERLNYANRLLDLIFIICLPFILISVGILIQKISSQNKFIIFWTTILIAVIFSCSLYLSYPRRDPYIFNKSINSSAVDFEIVKTINSQTDNYIVLANQAVSAAAVSEFGFNKYYNANMFYYPLPTSGPLYQLYLQTAYQQAPINDILDNVKNLVPVDNLYFVINSYWAGYDQIVNDHKNTADSWQQIQDQAFIFYYNLADKASQ